MNCGGDHPWFGLFSAGSTFSHWPANPCEDFVLAVAADEAEIGRVATHTSILDCNAYSVPGRTPPRPSSWLFLMGALEDQADGLGKQLPSLMDSWLTPARIRTGSEREGSTGIEGMAQVDYLYEGYAFSERAYQFRQVRPGAVRFTFEPLVPALRPAFVVNGWKGGNGPGGSGGSDVAVSVAGRRLAPGAFQRQREGDDLVIWLDTTLEAPVEIAIEPV